MQLFRNYRLINELNPIEIYFRNAILIKRIQVNKNQLFYNHALILTYFRITHKVYNLYRLKRPT
jgi:hypothetical protein